MIIIDKTAWHIDGMIEPKAVVAYFKRVFTWLANKGMLSEEGMETYNSGIDESISLNECLITKDALAFLSAKYNTYLENYFDCDENYEGIDKLYIEYIQENKQG